MTIVAPPAVGVNRPMVMVTVMLCTIMVALDNSLSVIALVHIKGALSATEDQVAWVVTGYFVSLAISTACASWFAGRFGRKRVYLTALVGFVASSVLSGSATTLDQLVISRLLQGLFAGPVIPLGQSAILDAYPPDRHGRALSIWAMGTLLAPVAGPTIGGVLTDVFTWRAVYYVNVPVGMLAIIAAGTVLHDTEPSRERRFDWYGFVALAVVLTTVQFMLDRGERLGWFDSTAIIVAAALAVLAVYVFIVHIATTDHPFISTALLKDRNMVIGISFVFFNGLLVFSSTLVLPIYLQNIAGYPVIMAGLLLGPRSLGTIAAMLLAGRLVSSMDGRAMMVFGYLMMAACTYVISTSTAEVNVTTFVVATFLHGFGFGFTWVPMVTFTFATLPREDRTEGSSIWSLCRNYGVGAGTAVAIAVLSRTEAESYAGLTGGVTPYTEAVRDGTVPPAWDVETLVGLTRLSREISRQSWLVGFNNDFRMMSVAALMMIPFVFLMAKPRRA